ncbi:type VII secretion protein EccCa [Mumia sp. zg.B17]|uniref:type VII secretion protein EccCa n=1 Tax=Mumia sp. zg.B17 TaxID=2855446 RepID=UPI001C6E7CA3|nr:type VII secretion protein EccCa [Mumia sp. zg.B17]MBW9205176.1 type VII secretion protein EccCa [Mumia sp. zg.B17]
MSTTLVRRPPRTAPPRVDDAPLSIHEPPHRTQAPTPAAGMTMLMMPIMSGTGSLTMALTQKDRPILVVAGFLVLIGSIAIGVVMIVSQRGGARRQMRESRERYLDYLEEMRLAVRERVATQRTEQAWRFPRPDELIGLAGDGARRWERRPSHGDFLSVRLGTGEVPLSSGLALDVDTGPLNEFDPLCLNAAEELQQRYATLSEQPITLPLRQYGQIAMIGHPAAARAVARTMLAQLVTLHAPGDLDVAVVRPEDAAAAWDWVKWLPHAQSSRTFDGEVPARRVATSVAALTELLGAELEERLDRYQRSRGAGVVGSHLVVIVDHDGGSGGHLESPDPAIPLQALGIHVVSLLPSPRHEPRPLDVRVEIGPDGSLVTAVHPSPFRADLLDEGTESTVARTLSGLRLSADEAGENGLEGSVGLAEILGVRDPAHLDTRRTWRPRALRDLLRVPIGISEQGSPVLLDLKESAHGGMGPHGLVVGATGSGKSEMLRTLVSSLLVGHGPDRLALMLVDFKGGATFAAMEHIPHLAGMITNLQDDLTLIDRMRDALYGEMQRRQEVLKSAGNLPNVTAYQEKIDAGEPLEPLPHLLVIVDEFSELLTAKPDFAELFVAIGRIGRSIGVHLLLATQKLEMGKIRGLESHLSYRISLRTFSESESRDAIGVPDAYHLPPEPGSGYLKVDTTVFERFKAALVSSPYVPPAEGPKTSVPVVPYVAVNGIGAWIADRAAAEREASLGEAAAEAAARKGGPTVLDVLCEQMTAAGAPRVRPVWLDPLPPVLTLDRVQTVDEPGAPATVRATLGLVDEPAKQAQYALEWDFTGAGSNLVLAGAPQTGKSTLLRTMVASLALRYAPGTVAFYCIDYGGGTLQALRSLPHVAAVATRNDPERINRTVQEVMAVLDEREELFRRYDLESMQDYRRAREEGRIPRDTPGDVFLVIDGWATFREEYDALDYAVDEIAARGGAYGVHVVLTVTQSMQIRMRMQPSFGGRLELRLNDLYDSQFGRKVMEQIPKEISGRGAMEGERIFQAAVPRIDGVRETEDVFEAQKELFTAITKRWEGIAVERVQTLAPVVHLEELPPVDPAYPGVPVGVLDRNLRAVSVNLIGSNPHLLVYGDPETGKTNFLKMLLKGYTQLMPPEQLGIVLVDFRRSLLDVVPEEYLVAYCTNREQTGQVATELAGSLHQRLPGPDVTSDQLRERSWWKGLELLVVVDDYDLVATSSGNPLDPLVEYIPQGNDLGFHLVASRRVNGLARAQFEPMLQRLTDVSTAGLMFSGDRLEGRLVGGVAPTRLPTGRALYVNRNGLIGQVQTGLVPEQHA